VSGARVLVIDDSETVRASLRDRLERSGYRVATAGGGSEGIRSIFETAPDVVLLDVVMPELDGWRTLERIRDISNVPVIMLTSRDSDIERVRGLRGGADDYVGKPFSASELTARIDAVLRRSRVEKPPRKRYDDGTVALDVTTREVLVRGEPVSLTPLEFRLLGALTAHAGDVLSRQELFDLVWGGERQASGDPVKTYVGYLRRKLERDPARPELIETVRGFGYRYCPPV
jgi:DNA-binding response OmpR family regulator